MNSLSNDNLVDTNTLISALFYMMTKYAHNQDKRLVPPIREHLMWLQNHPEFNDSKIQKISIELNKSWSLLSDEKQTCRHCSDVSSMLH